MREVWADIKGFEGAYQVSNLGRVRSLDHISVMKNGRTRQVKGRVLSPRKHTGGYLTVSLGNRNFYIHRLVAEAFLEKGEGKTEVNHKDGNKENNRADNLEWVTPSENQLHSKATGLAKVGEEHIQAKLTNEQVAFIRLNYKPRDRECGINPLARKFGVSPATIYRIVHGLRRVHG